MSTQRNKALLVSEVMIPVSRAPVIAETVIFKVALEEMGRTRLGIACIVDAKGKLLGILTDGDIRRKLLKVQRPFSAFLVDDALDHAIRSPITTRAEDTLVDVIRLMSQKQIWDLPVVDGTGRLIGLLHLHPAVEKLLGIQS